MITRISPDRCDQDRPVVAESQAPGAQGQARQGVARLTWLTAALSTKMERMLDERPQADRILVAQLHGTARRHARWRELTVAEHDAAVGELRDLAAGRADLLAHVAGILEGVSEGQLDEPLAWQAAGLCRDAGADPDSIPAWIEEGRRRKAMADMPPMSGGLRDSGPRGALAAAEVAQHDPGR